MWRLSTDPAELGRFYGVPKLSIDNRPFRRMLIPKIYGSPTLAGLCASRHSRIRVTRAGESRFAEGMYAGGNCFSLLGMGAALGPTITEADGPAFFETMGIPLLAGRALTEQDALEHRPVVVISTRVARQFFPDRSPLGQQVNVFGTDRVVVGVVADARYRSLRQSAEAMVYEPEFGPVLTQSEPRRSTCLGRLLAPCASRGGVRRSRMVLGYWMRW